MQTLSADFITFFLNALWQIPLIAAVAALACRLMRNSPAGHRHAVWVAALAASLLLPLASVRQGADTAALRAIVPPAAEPPASTFGAAPVPRAVSAARPTSRTILYAPAIAGILLAAYGFFLLLRCGKLLRAWLQTERIRQQADPARMRPLVEKVWLRCLSAFELYDVQLLASPTVPSPVTAGAWSTAIILPDGLFSETSEDVLSTAIGHEMAHIARRDFALRVLYEILWLPIAFHPAMLIIRRGIEQTREMACDELVTRKLLDAGVYARSIVTIAAVMSGLPRPGYTLGVFDGDILEQRVRRLLERPAANLKRARLLLATGLGAMALCVAIAAGLAISVRAQGGAASEDMKAGGAALNSGDLNAAIQHFQNAVRLEPSNVRPKLFLANALLREDTPQHLSEARRQYLDVLSLDPKNRQAIEGLASVSTLSKQFSEAHDWVMKLLAADPKNASAYYLAGFLDWSMIYPPYAQARAAAGMKPQDPGIIPDAAARHAFRDRYGAQLEEGFRMLQIALQLNPRDFDSMAYINLLYRIQSAIVETDAESRDQVAKADSWVQKALAEKKERAQSPRPAVSPLDVEGEAPGPVNGQMVVAPPPPPPPPPPHFAGDMNQPVSSVPMPQSRNVREMPGLFWQVAGGQSAADLVTLLRQKGFPFHILAAGDRLVRVMVGPYPDAQQLEQGKAALTAAGVQVLREW